MVSFGTPRRTPDYLLALARCHRSVLPVAWANADQQAATTAKQQAIGILQRLADQKPDDLTIQFELADTLAMTAQADDTPTAPGFGCRRAGAIAPTGHGPARKMSHGPGVRDPAG